LEEHNSNQKYSNYTQPFNQNIFLILETRLNKIGRSFAESKVLDFGCNVGNFLKSIDGKVELNDYVGLDVQKQSLDIAKKNFPLSQFLHYNRHNIVFNPSGLQNEPFPVSIEKNYFDYIIVYGVFTHFFFDEIESTVDELKKFLKPGGLILFSIWEDVDFYGYLGFLDRSFSLNVQLSKPCHFHKSIILADRKQILIDIDTPQLFDYTWVEAFYKPSFLINKLNCFRLQGSYSLHPVYAIKGD
jgi:SAM-dependent methyltransferase